MPDSVHLADYPVAHEERRDYDLERKMALAQKTVRMGRALRSMHNLKIRQPLRAIHLVTIDGTERKILREMEDIIGEELNVKEVVFRENEDELVEYQAKPNYRVLGKQLGKDMKPAAQKIESLSTKEIQSLLEGNTLHIDIGQRTLDLDQESVSIQREEKENLKVLNEGSLTVALDPEITEELRHEGLVRDVIRAVQNLRKESGLEVTDRIQLYVHAENQVGEAVESFQDYLMDETLAVDLHFEKHSDAQEVRIANEQCYIAVEKVS
jgi:isoleucyl-tRNA synthetase